MSRQFIKLTQTGLGPDQPAEAHILAGDVKAILAGLGGETLVRTGDGQLVVAEPPDIVMALLDQAEAVEHARINPAFAVDIELMAGLLIRIARSFPQTAAVLSHSEQREAEQAIERWLPLGHPRRPAFA